MTTVALIGLGEVGTVLAQELGARPEVRLTAWDLGFGSPTSTATGNARRAGLAPGRDIGHAVGGADLVISAVTAANTLGVARAAAPDLTAGCWFLDLNSAAPNLKQAAADCVEQAGGRYVEAALMSPVRPRRLHAPILLGGRHAEEFTGLARQLGFTGMTPYSDTIGLAAATKLCRSVVIKGVEALVTESLLAARHWGVQKQVLDSLSNLLPAENWAELATYLMSRSLEHGARRAEEMREAAAMVAETGAPALMSAAAARTHDLTAAHRDALTETTLTGMLDAIRARLSTSDRKEPAG